MVRTERYKPELRSTRTRFFGSGVPGLQNFAIWRRYSVSICDVPCECRQSARVHQFLSKGYVQSTRVPAAFAQAFLLLVLHVVIVMPINF